MPSHKYTEAEKKQVIDAALQSIATGQSLNAFCKANKYPYKTVYDWLTDDATNPTYARAKDVGTHYLANECLDIADELASMVRDHTPDEGGPSLNEKTQVAKLRIETRIRLIGKWNRKDYGEKVVQEHSGPNGSPLQMPAVNVFGLAPESKDGDS